MSYRVSKWLFFMQVYLLVLCSLLCWASIDQHSTWQIVVNAWGGGVNMALAPVNFYRWRGDLAVARIRRRAEALRAFSQEVADGQVDS